MTSLPPFRLWGSSPAQLWVRPRAGFLGSWDKGCGPQDCRGWQDLPSCLVPLPFPLVIPISVLHLPKLCLSGDRAGRPEGQRQWRAEYLGLRMQKRQRQIHFGPDFWVGPALSRRLDKMTSAAPFQPRLFVTLCFYEKNYFAVWFIWKAWAIFHVASIYSYWIFLTFKRNFRAFLPLSSSALH